MQGHRNPRADPPPPSGDEARLQRDVLTFVLSIDPTRLTQGELTRVLSANPEDAVQREAIVNAVTELVDVGLLCRDEPLRPTDSRRPPLRSPHPYLTRSYPPPSLRLRWGRLQLHSILPRRRSAQGRFAPFPFGARLAFPGLGRFASKHQPHRGQQEGRDEQGRAGGSADQGPRAE